MTKTTTAAYAIAMMRAYASTDRVKMNARFFKTGKGEYGEGDRFLGVTVPQTRIVARACKTMSMHEIQKLLASPLHEIRLLALMLWTIQFQHGDEKKRQEIFDAYLASTEYVNNWDLVDVSAAVIVGEWLVQLPPRTKGRVGVGCEKLKQLAASSLLWERRIAMVATYAWIRRGESEIPFAVADDVMCDSEDLIHKATGWMLREVGKRCDQKILKSYLLSSRKNDDLPRYRVMPRTMLRYAIEHFSAVERRRWLLGKV